MEAWGIGVILLGTALNVFIAGYVAAHRGYDPLPYGVAAAVITFIPPVIVLLVKPRKARVIEPDHGLLRDL